MSESEVNEVVVEFELVEAHEPSSSLSPGQLNIVKVLNLNNTGNNEKEYIRSIEFHPTSQVALVADSGSVVNLHQVRLVCCFEALCRGIVDVLKFGIG